ncbi:MAG: hypothetical protein ACYS0G_16755, partial [Planctomycetota bacterium]
VNGETTASCYQAAVGADSTLYLPLDISSIGKRMLFSGSSLGYRFTFAADDIAIYNTQGVLMQLLGPDEEGIYTIADDQDAELDGASSAAYAMGLADAVVAPVPGADETSGASSSAINFDSSPDTTLAELFTPSPGPTFDQLRGQYEVGTGSPASGGIVFTPDLSSNRQYAALINSSGGLEDAGAAVRMAVDARVPDLIDGAIVELRLWAGGGETAFLQLKAKENSSRFDLSVHKNANASAVITVGRSFTSNWVRLDASFQYTGSDIAFVASASDIGPDGTDPAALLVELAGTFANDGIEGNPVIIRGFGAKAPDGTVVPILLDNFTDSWLPPPVTTTTSTSTSTTTTTTLGGASTSTSTTTTTLGRGSTTTTTLGGGVDRNVRGFRLTYNRHEFQTYRIRHALDPNYFFDPGDPAWHADGTRHVDHDHLIVAIRGKEHGVFPPPPGRTRPFHLQLGTTLADDPDRPAAAARVLDHCTADSFTVLCGPTPRAGCHVSTKPQKAALVLKDVPRAAHNRLQWKWIRGQATELANFGDPMTSDDAALCLYDESGSEPILIFAATAPAGSTCGGRPCWKQMHSRRGERGYRYKDKALVADGIRRMLLQPGEHGKAKILVAARGVNLALPALPLQLPLRVQLQAATGQCWEATYSEAGTKQNDERRFRAKAD